MKKKLYIFLFSILSLALLYLLFFRIVGRDLAWLAFPTVLLFLKWFDLSILRGIFLFQSLSKERIDLNLKAAGVKKNSFLSFLKLRVFILLFFVFSTFIYILRDDIFNSLDFISQQFRFTHAFLRIEYPSFSESAPEEIKLSDNNMKISVDTSSYLEIKIKNLKSDSNWKLNLRQLNSDSSMNYSYKLSSTGLWSSSVSSLYEQFFQEDLLLQEKKSDTNLKKEVKVIEFLLTNGKDKYLAQVEILPTPLPIVKLEPIRLANQESEKMLGKLHFYLDVTSTVPLSLVVLSVRTKSGYRFEKTFAEFANASQLKFTTESAELVTLGIPFLPEDILYVKAVAKTVLSGVTGESKELEFPVRTPLQVRKEIILNLEKALKDLNSMKSANNLEKESILDSLSKGAQLAQQMSRAGIIRKNVIESMSFVENINKKNDKFYREAHRKIQLTLDLLKRQQKMDEGGNFLARLQNFKYNISKLQNTENGINEVLSDSKELKDMAIGLNRQLLNMSQQQSFGLTQLEKSIVQNILQNDRTAEKIKDTADQLKQKNLSEAQRNAQMAFEEGTKHLGSAMQILQQARNRSIQEARKQLQSADNHLENSKSSDNKNEVAKDLANAKQSLDKTPQLGEEFNESLAEARDEVHTSQKFIQTDKSTELEKSTRLAQFAIEKALLALQDEEESDRELQKEQDARAFRSSMDVLAAQGLLDSSWRKKILEEIARLKSQGEQSDSPMIRYLESRLR